MYCRQLVFANAVALGVAPFSHEDTKNTKKTGSQGLVDQVVSVHAPNPDRQIPWREVLASVGRAPATH